MKGWKFEGSWLDRVLQEATLTEYRLVYGVMVVMGVGIGAAVAILTGVTR